QDITFGAPVTLNNASLAANGLNSITTNAAVSSLNSISLTSPTIGINAPLGATTMSLLGTSTSSSVAQDAAGVGVVTADSLTVAPPDLFSPSNPSALPPATPPLYLQPRLLTTD